MIGRQFAGGVRPCPAMRSVGNNKAPRDRDRGNPTVTPGLGLYCEAVLSGGKYRSQHTFPHQKVSKEIQRPGEFAQLSLMGILYCREPFLPIPPHARTRRAASHHVTLPAQSGNYSTLSPSPLGQYCQRPPKMLKKRISYGGDFYS